MWKWLRASRREATDDHLDRERLLRSEREAQTLRLELEDQARTLSQLRQQVDRQERSESDRIAETLRAQIERLIAAAATPITQLNTQAHLLEAEGRPVSPKDVMANVHRLLRAFEDEGMGLEGCVNDVLGFDPGRHEPLANGAAIRPGQSVAIQFAAVTYRGRILRKAGVVAREC